MIPYSHVLMLSLILFAMGMVCMVVRKNLIMVVLGLEIMLNAAVIAFIGAALKWHHMEGQAMAIFIIAAAAAEVSVGLALIVAAYRHTGSVHPDSLLQLKE